MLIRSGMLSGDLRPTQVSGAGINGAENPISDTPNEAFGAAISGGGERDESVTIGDPERSFRLAFLQFRDGWHEEQSFSIKAPGVPEIYIP